MKSKAVRVRSRLPIAVIVFALAVPTGVVAQVVHPGAFVSLGTAVAVGDTVSLPRTGSPDAFVVPPGRALVLTDIVVSPQATGVSEPFVWQIFNGPSITTNMNVTSMPSDPSSYQVHLTTGMVFPAGSEVRFMLVFGDAAFNVSATGYLVRVLR